LRLANGANSLSVADVSYISGDIMGPVPMVWPPEPAPPPSDDTLSLLNNVSGVLIDLGAGANTINLWAGTNSISVQDTGGFTSINGTSSKDTLTLVNDVHDIRIDLGAGDDTLTLGTYSSGNTVIPSTGNMIVYADGDGEDIINGFVHENRIDLTGVAGVHSLDDLNARQCYGDTVIEFGNGDSLTLSGVSLLTLNDGDFIFAPNHAASITGDATGELIEDATYTVPSGSTVYLDTDSGTLTVHDIDSGEDHFRPVDSEHLDGHYGQFTFDSSSGHWTYHVDSACPAVQRLSGGATVTDTLTVTSADGTASRDIVVTITGTNDAPVFDGEGLNPTYDGDSSVALVHKVVAKDVDSANYLGGSLTATVTAGGNTGDTLSIVGTQHISLMVIQSGTRVMYDSDGVPGGAIEIGTLSDNINSLTVALNDFATDVAVAALTEAIEFSNSTSNPTPGTRTVTFTLQDGGGTANNGHDSDYFDATVVVPAPPVDDEAPVVTGDMSIVAVKGGGEVKLTVTDLNADDPDTDACELTFTIDDLNHGILTFGNDRQVLGVDDTFTLADIQAGRVYYQSVGDYVGQDHITLSLSDGVPGTPSSVVKLGATIVDAQFTVQTSAGYDFDQHNPIAKMGLGVVVPGAADPSHTFRILAGNTDFYVTGYGFDYDTDNNSALIDGTITFIQEVTGGDDHTPIASFGLSVNANHWYNAAAAASHGDQSLIEALTQSWTFNFIGNAGIDAFAAGDVNDIFTGRAGSDTLDGQDGLDRAYYGGATGPIQVGLAAGIVLERSPNGQFVASTDTLRSIELVTGSNYNDEFYAIGFGAVDQYGPTGQNIGSAVPGNSGGLFNEFEGRGGIDTVIGNGQTRISYYHATAGVTVTFAADSWTSFASGGSGMAEGDASVGTDYFMGVNSVRGSFFDDSFTGSNNPNQSAENFEGLGGDDSIDGGLGFDRANYFSAADGDGINVDLGAGTVSGGIDTGSDMLYSIEAIRGTNFSDFYDASNFSGSSANAGNAGDNGAASNFNEFEGGGGDDTVTGNGNTRVAFTHATGGVVVTLAPDGDGEASGNDSVGHDTFQGGVRHVRGSDFNDIITGNSAGNYLEGRGGNDIIDSGGGNDEVTGGTGADIFVYGPGHGDDAIADFNRFEADRIDLRAFSSIHSVDDLVITHGTVDGVANSTILTFDGETLSLRGYDSVAHPLQASDFIFNAPTGSSIAVSVQTPDGYDFSTMHDDLAAGFLVSQESTSDHFFIFSPYKHVNIEMAGAGFTYDPGSHRPTGGTITEINILDRSSMTTQDHVLVNSSGWNIDAATFFNGIIQYASVDVPTHLAGLAALNGIFNAATYNYVGSGNFPQGSHGRGYDVFVGGSHADVFNGLNDWLGPFGSIDAGFDIVDYSHATAVLGAGVTADLLHPENNAGDAQGDVFISIEGLRGSDFNDTLRGDGNNNTIEGGGGDDTLDGGANGFGIDYVSYQHATAGVTVNLGVTTQQNTQGAGYDTLSNFEAVLGSSHDDTLIGNGNSYLEGDGGDDHLIGQVGGNDTAVYDLATAAVTVDLSLSTQQNTYGAGLDTLTNIANVTASRFNDTLTGDAHNNKFWGLSGDDTFVFRASEVGIGHDSIADFAPGEDHIELDYAPFTPGDANSFNAWISSHATFSTQSGGLVIDLNLDGQNHDTITLFGVPAGRLTMNDFILNPGGGNIGA
jgi:VCBS repeat-containing protein